MAQCKYNMSITHEQAEIAATEWCGIEDSPVRRWLVSAILDPTQHRDIGKFLAPIAEIVVCDWLVEKTGTEMSCVSGRAYDIHSSTGIRTQVKFRMGVWHLETTRRNSAANQDTNATGHVAYRADEFDVLAVFVPGPNFGLTGSKKRLIPVDALRHPERPAQLVTRVNAAVRRRHDNDETTLEVLRDMFLQTPPSPRDLYRAEETLGSELYMLDPTSQNQQMDLDTNPPLDYTEILFAQEV